MSSPASSGLATMTTHTHTDTHSGSHARHSQCVRPNRRITQMPQTHTNNHWFAPRDARDMLESEHSRSPHTVPLHTARRRPFASTGGEQLKCVHSKRKRMRAWAARRGALRAARARVPEEQSGGRTGGRWVGVSARARVRRSGACMRIY